MSTLSVDTIQGKTTAGTVAMPSGHIVQVVNGRLANDRYTTTSTSFTQLGNSLAITPKFSTSKILLLASASFEMNGSHYAFFDFGKTTGGTTTQNLSGVGAGIITHYSGSWTNCFYSFQDSPSTTNAVSYFSSVKVSGGTKGTFRPAKLID